MADNLFRAFLRAQPDLDRIFIAAGEGRNFSFREAFALAGRFAAVLAAHDVKSGDRVAVQVDKSPEALFLYLACLRAGAIYLPLNTGYTANEIAYLVADAEPRLFVASEKNSHAIASLMKQGEVLTLEADGTGSLMTEAASAGPDFADADLSMNDVAAILYTSGTTGRSKGAMLTHGNLYANASSLRNAWHYTAEDVLLHALPIYHTHGLFVATNLCLLSGARMIMLPKFDPDAVFQALPHASVMMGVPTYYTRLLKEDRLNRQATRHMRLFISGSAPLLAETHREWSARTGHQILERYGMTETNMIASNPYAGPRVPGSVGLALPGVEVRIADQDGQPLKAREVGIIEVRGANVFHGYWRMPERSDKDFRKDGFFITGDMGYLDAQNYLTIVGREKDLIISGGLNIYPKEVENEIDALAGIEESAVIGLPHADLGEAVTAVIVAKKDAALGEKEILARLSGKLARFKHPKRAIFVSELPRNSMGKVQKSILRDRFKDLYRAG
jgi:malonyl-CoA/methylmalonyl-CoA synthetase